MKITIFLFCLIFLISSLPLDPKKISVSINCGSSHHPVTSADGNFKYEPDSKYVSGASVQVDYQADNEASQAQIKFTFQKQLYMYERHTYSEMTYSLPVRMGKNTLILKFAQMYFKQPNKRVFDIKIGKNIVIKSLDVIAKTGSRFSAHEEYLEFELRKDGVYIQNSRIDQAYESGKLKLTFSKGKADNPIIQGIILYNGPIQSSTKEQYTKLRVHWQTQKQMRKAKKEQSNIKELIQTQNKRQKIIIRNDQLVIEEIQSTNTVKVPFEKYGRVRSFLMSPVGIIAWAFGFLYFGLFLYRKVFMLDQNHQFPKLSGIKKKND